MTLCGQWYHYVTGQGKRFHFVHIIWEGSGENGTLEMIINFLTLLFSFVVKLKALLREKERIVVQVPMHFPMMPFGMTGGGGGFCSAATD